MLRTIKVEESKVRAIASNFSTEGIGAVARLGGAKIDLLTVEGLIYHPRSRRDCRDLPSEVDDYW